MLLYRHRLNIKIKFVVKAKLINSNADGYTTYDLVKPVDFKDQTRMKLKLLETEQPTLIKVLVNIDYFIST